MKVMVDKHRDSNFELLRIICIFLILFQHFVEHGVFDTSNDLGNIQRLLLYIMDSGGNLGVNVFVLISGYYLVNSKFSKKKLINLVLQIWIYSTGIYGISLLAGITQFTWDSTLKAIFPIYHGSYWFATAYILLYLIFPLINIIINSITKKQFELLIIILSVIWSIFPTLFNINFDFSNLRWFMLLYLYAAYIRLYMKERFQNTIKVLCSFVGLLLFIFFSIVMISLINIKIVGINISPVYFCGMNKIPLVLCSIFLFLLFRNVTISYSKIINMAASTVFGIYLFHDNRIIRTYLWSGIFHVNEYTDSTLLILYGILVSLIIFVVGFSIEKIRQYCFSYIQRYLLLPLYRFYQNR